MPTFLHMAAKGEGGRTKEDPVEWIPFRSVSFQRGEGMPLREYVTVRMYVRTSYSNLQCCGSGSARSCIDFGRLDPESDPGGEKSPQNREKS